MCFTRVSAIAAIATASSAFATVTPGTLFGDSYIVKKGSGGSARFFSVLDVYIRCSSSSDIISGGILSGSSYESHFTMNQGLAFVHSNNAGLGSGIDAWKPATGQASWDSFITCGWRDQDEAARNSTPSPDWPTAGSSEVLPSGTSLSFTTPCTVGHYNGQTGSINTAKTASDIAGNGITVGQRLDNHWMIGRFAVDVTQTDPNTPVTGPLTMSLKFFVAGKNNGTVTFPMCRFDYTLNFAVPAPGAVALMGLAGVMGRRRSA